MRVMVDADRLTTLLADRSAAIVPDGIYVEGGSVLACEPIPLAALGPVRPGRSRRQ